MRSQMLKRDIFSELERDYFCLQKNEKEKRWFNQFLPLKLLTIDINERNRQQVYDEAKVKLRNLYEVLQEYECVSP